MWDWLQGLQGGAPAVVGSAAGSAFGLISLLFGALVNAHLNRKRDDRLRCQEQVAVLTAIATEIENIVETLRFNAEKLESAQHDFRIPDVAHSLRLTPRSFDKLVGVSREAILAAVNAQTLVDQYADHLLYRGGEIIPGIPKGRTIVAMPLAASKAVIAINEGTAEKLAEYASLLLKERDRLSS